MSLQAWNSPLRARKSWFLLGDEIAAIGNGIACPEQHIGVGWDGERRRTETIVENRKLGAEGTNRFIVDDVEKPSGMNWTELMPGVSWAHLEGNEPGSGIGYYFPGGAMVHGLREERRDRWRSINIRNDSDREASNSFLSLWFDHGTSPEHADYAYVLLPGLTASETGKYAADPGIVVAANTEDVH
ncbi:polysaccharide lyase family 8 super-sandwich domain-containing protein, partial [Mycobacterium tuberculosis]